MLQPDQLKHIAREFVRHLGFLASARISTQFAGAVCACWSFIRTRNPTVGNEPRSGRMCDLNSCLFVATVHCSSACFDAFESI